MEFDFNKLRDEAMAFTKQAQEKMTEAGALAKAKFDVRNKEKELDEMFRLLGVAYYEAHKDVEVPVPEAETFATIKKIADELKAMSDNLLDTQGAVTCPVCGKKQSKSHAFCDGCGAPLK